MKHDDRDPRSRKAHDAIPTSPIPGDPFPWQSDSPSAQGPHEPADSSADPGDLYPFDLGGGD